MGNVTKFDVMHSALRNQVVFKTESPQNNSNLIDFSNSNDDHCITLSHYLYCPIQIPEQSEEQEKGSDATTTSSVFDKQNEKSLQIHINKTMSTPKWLTDNPSSHCFDNGAKGLLRSLLTKKLHEFQDKSLRFDGKVRHSSSVKILSESKITAVGEDALAEKNIDIEWHIIILQSVFPCFQKDYKGY